LKDLNQAGAQGFKVVAMAGGIQAALAKQEKGQYEYAQFQTKGYLWDKVGFEAAYSRLSKRGFHVVADVFGGKLCNDMFPGSGISETVCVYSDTFIVERRTDLDEPLRDQRLAFAGPSFSEKTATALNAQIGSHLAEGFVPTLLLSKFEVLLEQANSGDKRLIDKANLHVVASGHRDDIWNQVNQMAKHGYRLSLVGNRIGLMERNPANATPTSYIWLDATDSDFDKQLEQLQNQGAVYRMTYTSEEGRRDKLIFEQKVDGDNTKREYKVLKFELSTIADAANQNLTIDLKPESKETMKQLNSMVKQGYVVCDLFLKGAPLTYYVLITNFSSGS
jgi:hypothetical protein